MQRPNGSTLNITDDGIQISAGRDNIGRHNLNCIARGPGGITNRLVQVDVLNDYWTNIIFSSLISICCFISAVIIVSIILAVRVTLLRKKRKKKIAKYLGPAIYDIATGV